MQKQQSRNRRRRKLYRFFFWEHDFCFCRKCAPVRWERYLLGRAVYVEPR